MARRFTIFAIASILLCGAVAAQPYGSDYYTVGAGGTLFRVQQNGTTTSITSGGSRSDGITMGYDNRAIYWSTRGNTSSVSASVNELRGSTNTTVFTTNDFRIDELELNQNGELAFTGVDVSRAPNVTGLFKWSGGSSVSTIATTAQLGVASASLNGGLDINVTTGNYLVTGSAFTLSQIWDVSESGAVTSLVTGTIYRNTYTISQDRRDGLIYQGGTGNYTVITGSGTTTSLTPSGGTSPLYYCIRMDRSSTPNTMRQLHVVYHSTNTAQNYLHRVSNPSSSSPSVTSTALSIPGATTATGMVFDGERNLATAKTGPGAYDINVSFPNEGGATYVLVASAAGYRPGFPLNGLHVGVNVDNLFVLSAQNALRPFFNPGPGTLDGGGNARGAIALGQDNLGVMIHLVAATIVNFRLNTVSEPQPLKL